MKVCGFCDCLVQREEDVCPFCDAVLREASSPRAVTLVGFAAALSACGPAVDGNNMDESGGSSSGTGPVSTTLPTASTTSTSTSTTSADTTLPTTSVGSSSGTDETTGVLFIENPDGGGALYGECDPFDQDCPPGEKCIPWANDGGDAWNATRCSPIAEEPNLPGDPCTVEASPVSGLEDCDGTSMCFHADPDDLTGTCVSFCQGTENDPTCPNPADVCNISNDGVLSVCLEPCDPLAQNCSDATLSCVAGTNQFVCLRPGDGQFGDDCSQPMDCDVGLSCVEAAFDDCKGACCTEPCDPDAPACTDPLHECTPLGDAGVCTDPS